MNKNRTFLLALAGIFSAVVFVATFIIRVPAPTGYINLGDGVILFTAVWLGGYAVIPATVGSTLADLLSFPLYAPATLVIKSLMALTAVGVLRFTKGKLVGRVVAFIMAEALMIVGYFLYDTLVYGFGGAVANVAGNGVQAVAGIVLGWALSMIPRPAMRGRG